MKFQKSLLLAALFSLSTAVSAWAASPIVEKMKTVDQQRLQAEKSEGCGKECETARRAYHWIGPAFYEMQLKNDTLTPEQLYILGKVKELIQKEADVIDLYERGERMPYNAIRNDVQATMLDMLTYTAQMKEVSGNDVKVLAYAAAKVRALYADASWQEGWVADRDTTYLYAYTDGLVAVLDRFLQDLPKYVGDIPNGRIFAYSWANSVAMQAIAEFTKPMEPAYHDAVQELYDTYARKSLNLVLADTSLSIEYKMRNAVDSYHTYKAQVGTTYKNNLIAATQDALVTMLKQNNATIKGNEQYFWDYSQTIGIIDEFAVQKEIPAASKKQLWLQWYQSFMAGLDQLDISIYQGEFYWRVDSFVTDKLKAFAQAQPAEMKKLAAKLLAKVKTEKNPKDAAAYKKTVALLTKLSK